MKSHRKDWADRIPKALWSYRTMWRNTTGFSPYEMVYGKTVVFPIEFEVKTLRTATNENLDLMESQKNQLNQLLIRYGTGRGSTWIPTISSPAYGSIGSLLGYAESTVLYAIGSVASFAIEHR